MWLIMSVRFEYNINAFLENEKQVVHLTYCERE